MTVLCDYIQILGDNLQTIPQTAAGAEVPLGQGPGGPGTFNTGGREPGTGTQVAFTAFLIYSVRDLAGSAEVVVNNASVGFITASAGAVFTTQMIALAGSTLNDGDNTIVIRNVTDTFTIKNVYCFFHQSP